MDELVKLVSDKKDKLPEPVAGQIDGLLSGAGDGMDLGSVSKGLGGRAQFLLADYRTLASAASPLRPGSGLVPDRSNQGREQVCADCPLCFWHPATGHRSMALDPLCGRSRPNCEI